ncbi:hypothetical protein AYI68_g108 [Smittium mucronatum]|uniref:Arrestin-like N-terminal domain-containing protein n=1 Tax=Smittium mucronatum TaxID=133383 RepID=A0A1R0H9C3_9FUNG|nr:hypothetical protein AYI68_g108 [Smittium mucronatum]
MLSGSHLDIILQNDTVLFHGDESMTSSKLIYGKALIYLKSCCKIKSIYIRISGTSSCSPPVDPNKKSGNGCPEVPFPRTVFLDHTESLFQSKNKNGSPFSAKTYEYEFMFKIDGSLPATVSTGYGNIEYKLDLVLEKTGLLSKNSTKSIPIYVRRIIDFGRSSFPSIILPSMSLDQSADILATRSSDLTVNDLEFPSVFSGLESISNIEPIPGSLNPSPSQQLVKNFGSRLQLKLTTGSSIISSARSLLVTVELYPLHQSTRVINYGVSLCERMEILSPSTGPQVYCRIISSAIGNLSTALATSKEISLSGNSHELDLRTNSGCGDAHVDVDNNCFRISHYLKFHCAITYKDRRMESSAAMPIFVVPNEYFSEFNSLPLYCDIQGERPPAYCL